MPEPKPAPSAEPLAPAAQAVLPELVDAVRELLRVGLDEDFLRSCVRIGAYEPFGGGMKADAVGGLRVDIAAVLKIGSDELDLHARLMSAVSAVVPRVFPKVLALKKLPAGRRLLLMEQLRKYDSLQSSLYSGNLPESFIPRLAARMIEHVRAVHIAGVRARGLRSRLPQTCEPFRGRIESRLAKVLELDPPLAAARALPGRVLGQACPPLNSILDALAAVPTLPASTLVLQHGDPHLGNAMWRRYGPNGFAMRLIDPNPTIGYSSRLYDFGKMLHWAEPVGWAHAHPEQVRGAFVASKTAWRLTPSLAGDDPNVERARLQLETALRREILACCSHAEAKLLPLAVAAAHIGFAALPSISGNARRFAFAYTLRALAEWHDKTLHPTVSRTNQ